MMKFRLARGLKVIAMWCRENRHKPLAEQHEALCRKIRGHYAYFGLSGNSQALGKLLGASEKIWIKWLRRRSQRHALNWEEVGKLLKYYKLPRVRLKTIKLVIDLS